MGDKTYPLDDNYSKEQTVRVNVGSTKLISPEPVIDEIEKKCGVGSVLACVPKNDTGYEVVMRERRNVGEISGDSISIQVSGKDTAYYRVIHNDQVKVCSGCYSAEHLYRDCPEFKCFKCGQQGHISKNCSENKCKSCLRTKTDCDCLTRKRYFGEGFGQTPEGKEKHPGVVFLTIKENIKKLTPVVKKNNAELTENVNENDLASVNTSDIGPSVISSEQGTSDDVKINGEDGNGEDADDGNGNGNDDDGNGEIGDDNEGDGIGNGDEDDEDEYTDADEAMEDDVTETVDNASDNGEKTKIATDNSVKTKIATEMTDKDSEQISDGQIVTVSNISKCNLLLSTNEIVNENVSCETTVNDEKLASSLSGTKNAAREEMMVFLNIYAPNNVNEKYEFFLKCKQKISKEKYVLVAGDFNTTLSSLDKSGKTLHCNDKAVKSLCNFMQEKGLYDIWRNRNVNTKVFSRKQVVQGFLIQSRIDYFLVSLDLKSCIKNIHYKDTSFSDHSIVSMKVDFCNVEKGPELKTQLEDIETYKCKGAILRSKSQWALETDRNTAYFLKLEKYRQNKNVISEIKDRDGKIVTETNDLLDVIHDYYKHLFSCVSIDMHSVDKLLNNVNVKIDDEDVEMCDNEINIEEIEKSLKGMKKGKTPGPDGKDIADTVASVRDFMDLVEMDDIECYLLKLDQEKAFDRAGHEYLFAVLDKFGFGNKFKNLIKIFYTNIFSSVKCNGFLTPYFRLKNSVKQGCPISALLYVLLAEPLSIAIKKNCEIRGVVIPNTNVEEKVFVHADDTTLTLVDKNSVSETFRTFIEAGVCKIKDIAYECKPGFLKESYIQEIVLEKFPEVSENKMLHAVRNVLETIPDEYKVLVEANVHVSKTPVLNPMIKDGVQICSLPSTTSFYYQMLVSKLSREPKSVSRWRLMYADFDLRKVQKIINFPFLQSDCREIAFKFFHRIIFTRKAI
ncbi:unnamed protein product [Mytilus coruscus]|uniref:CCHC-type domain-containing protein n=1 Tax=Mytilus coruscus TaxID=42192 RepID=A0A6J8C8H4_MYTCO|nr:unnamed protein product [Mytilus coruscus]